MKEMMSKLITEMITLSRPVRRLLSKLLIGHTAAVPLMVNGSKI